MAHIYIIKNTLNNKVYVGTSYVVKSRKRNHFRCLKQNNHDSKHLQNAYNKYGKSAFEFHIIDECERADMFDCEVMWQDIFKSYNGEFGYNMQRTGGGYSQYTTGYKYDINTCQIKKYDNMFALYQKIGLNTTNYDWTKGFGKLYEQKYIVGNSIENLQESYLEWLRKEHKYIAYNLKTNELRYAFMGTILAGKISGNKNKTQERLNGVSKTRHSNVRKTRYYKGWLLFKNSEKLDIEKFIKDNPEQCCKYVPTKTKHLRQITFYSRKGEFQEQCTVEEFGERFNRSHNVILGNLDKPTLCAGYLLKNGWELDNKIPPYKENRGGAVSRSIPVECYDQYGTLIKQFSSGVEAGKWMGSAKAPQKIRDRCKGYSLTKSGRKRPTHYYKGYYWYYTVN